MTVTAIAGLLVDFSSPNLPRLLLAVLFAPLRPNDLGISQGHQGPAEQVSRDAGARARGCRVERNTAIARGRRSGHYVIGALDQWDSCTQGFGGVMLAGKGRWRLRLEKLKMRIEYTQAGVWEH